MKEHCLQVQRGRAKVKASWIYRGKLPTPISQLIINILGSILETHMQWGVFVVAIAGGFRSVF